MHQKYTKIALTLRAVAVVMLVLFAGVLSAAPAGALEDGYSDDGAYVGSNTTVLPEVAEQPAPPPAELTPVTAADPTDVASQTLPFTGGDATQAAVIGAFLLLAGIAALGWRRRTAES